MNKSIPKVPAWRIFGQLPGLNANPIPVIGGNIERFGKIFTTYLGFDPIHVTTDPAFAQYVLQKNHKNYRKTKFVKVIAEMIGNGLLTSDNPYWLKQRRLIQPSFHRKKLEALGLIMSNEIASYEEDLRQKISNSTEGLELNVLKEMMELTLQIVLRSLFTTGLTRNEIDLVDHHLTALQSLVIMRLRRPFVIPFMKLGGQLKKYERMQNEMDAIIYRIIEERRNETSPKDDLLSMLLEARYEESGEGMDNQQIRDESLIIVLAGHETTANSLAWTLYLLSQHPAIKEKLLQEFEDILGDRTANFSDVRSLVYTKQVIEESMRIYPPAWIMDRQTIEEDQLGPYTLKKGQMINFFIYGIHHDPELWPEPEKFDPERFAPENAKARKPFSYFPFGGGPRLCIGNNFALMEMALILPSLLRKFKFEYVGKKAPELQPLVTLRPKNGMPMRVSLRNTY